MAAGSWMSAIGDALSVGGGAYHKLKREEEDLLRQEQRDKISDEFQRLQMKLMQGQEERSIAGDQRAQLSDERENIRWALEDAGPNGDLAPDVATRARELGMGSRVADREAQLPSSRFGVNSNGQMDPSITHESAGQTAGFTVTPNARERAALEDQSRQNELFGMQKAGHERETANADWASSAEAQGLSTDDYNRQATSRGMAGRERTIAELKDMETFRNRLGMNRDAASSTGSFTKEKQWVSAFQDNFQRHTAALAESFASASSDEERQRLLEQAAASAEALTTRMLGPNPNVPPTDVSDNTALAIASINAKAEKAGSLQALIREANSPEGRKGLTDNGVDVKVYFSELARRSRVAQKAEMTKPAPSAVTSFGPQDGSPWEGAANPTLPAVGVPDSISNALDKGRNQLTRDAGTVRGVWDAIQRARQSPDEQRRLAKQQR